MLHIIYNMYSVIVHYVILYYTILYYTIVHYSVAEAWEQVRPLPADAAGPAEVPESLD